MPERVKVPVPTFEIDRAPPPVPSCATPENVVLVLSDPKVKVAAVAFAFSMVPEPANEAMLLLYPSSSKVPSTVKAEEEDIESVAPTAIRPALMVTEPVFDVAVPLELARVRVPVPFFTRLRASVRRPR